MARKEVLKGYGGFVRIPYEWLKMCKKYSVENQEGVNKNITINLNEVFLLARIAGWNDQGKDCTETNNTLAEVLNVSVDTIKKYIKELRLVGLIKTYEEKDTPMHTSQRTIYIQYDVIDKILGINVSSDDSEVGTNIHPIRKIRLIIIVIIIKKNIRTAKQKKIKNQNLIIY